MDNVKFIEEYCVVKTKNGYEKIKISQSQKHFLKHIYKNEK